MERINEVQSIQGKKMQATRTACERAQILYLNKRTKNCAKQSKRRYYDNVSINKECK